MDKGFRKIYWSVLLAMLHINLGTVTILPDFAVYMIINNGIKDIRTDYDCLSFHRAQKLSYFGIAFGIISFIQQLSGASLSNVTALNLLVIQGGALVRLMLFFMILTGAAEILSACRYEGEARKYIVNIRIYTILNCILISGAAVCFTMHFMGVATILAFLIGLPLNIWLLVMVSDMRRIKGLTLAK